MNHNFNNKIILFDGVCNLCSGTVKFITKRDKKSIFKFASLQSNFGQNFLIKFNLPVSDFNTFVLIENEKLYIKSKAAFKVIGEFGGFWKILLIFRILPTFISDFFYDIVSKYRYKIFGKKESCMIPDDNILERFIN
jgi:predicted DCC family thiol-disulfide oxidoreductase YuxK